MKQLKPKKIFNQSSDETFNEARILNGNPNGIFNFNSTNHKWATELYKKMEARTWFPGQVNISKDKNNYLYLTPSEKRSYDLVLAQLIANDSIQTNQLMDRINSYITSPIVNACLSRQSSEESTHCLIEGTEVLTNRGFIDFKDLTYEDRVANYCNDGRIFFNYPKDIVHNNYKGELIEFSMRNYKQIVTPNHRMVMRNTNYERVNPNDRGKIKIREASEASVNNYDLPIAGYNIGNTSILNIIDRLGIIFQADGSVLNNYNYTKDGYCYRFGFKREDKINRLNAILNYSNLKYTKTLTDDGVTHFYVWIKFKYDKEFSWVTLEDKNPLYIMSFLDELCYWDGSIRSEDKNSILFTNSNRKAIDKVIELSTLAGCQTGVYTIVPNEATNNKIHCWQVHIVMGKDHKTGRDIIKTTIPYEGSTYCCMVDTGMIICRYEDNVFVTGNSFSYSVMAEDIAMDTDRIYNMHKHDDELALKNKAVESMYDSLVKEYKDIDLTESINMFYKLHGSDVKLSDLEYFINNLKNDIIEKHTENITPTDEDLLVAFGANQILEELVFPGGFIVLLSLGHKMPATAEMIAEIQKDETLSHVQLFKNIFRTAVDESFGGVVPDTVTKKITEMIIDMAIAEKRWTKYVTQGLLGFSDRAIDIFIEDQANNICSNLRLPLIFEKHKDNPLRKILNKTLKGGGTDSREAFFESNVASYSKGSVETDF